MIGLPSSLTIKSQPARGFFDGFMNAMKEVDTPRLLEKERKEKMMLLLLLLLLVSLILELSFLQ